MSLKYKHTETREILQEWKCRWYPLLDSMRINKRSSDFKVRLL